MSSIRPQNHMHILILVGGIAIVGLFMPIFSSGGNVPVGDALSLIENTFLVVSNSTDNTYNATADADNDILQLIAGDGMIITVDSVNDRFYFNTTSGGGGGEANVGSNVGSGAGTVFRDKSGVTLNFKSIATNGNGIVVTNNANDIELSLNNVPKSTISLSGQWIKADLPSDTVYRNGCNNGEILEYQTSNSSWICAVDNAGAGGNSISEGNSDATINDAGTGTLDVTLDGSAEYQFTGSLVDFNSNRLTKVGSPTVATDAFPANELGLLGNMVTSACADGEILKYQNSNGTWICSVDGGGGGGGENTSASNVGTGLGVFKIEVGDDLRFNSLIGGDSIDITDTTDDLTIAVTTDSIGDIQLANNIDTIQLADGTVTKAEFQYINTLTSNAQTQLNNKLEDITGESIHTLANVTNLACANNEILKANSSGFFECTVDVDTNNFEVSDGDKTDITVSGSGLTWNLDTGVVSDNELASNLDVTQLADGTVTSTEFQYLNTVTSNVQTQLNNKLEDITGESIHTLANVTNFACSTNEILKVNSTGFYECSVDVDTNNFEVSDGDKGDITVSGSGLIWNVDTGVVGDNELASNLDVTQLADGTVNDTEFQFINTVTSNVQTQLNNKLEDITNEASTNLTDTANVAYLNTPNEFLENNIQTFHDDDIEIRNPTNTFDYILSTGAIGADRTISLPVLTGNDVFVFEAHSQTLTNKILALGSNTISGTSAQFDTANTDGNFVFEADNISVLSTSSTAQFDTAVTGTGFVYESDNISALSASTTGQFDSALTGTGFVYESDNLTALSTSTFAQLNSHVSDATVVDLNDSQTLTNKDISSTTNTYGNIEQMANVTPTGCADNEILKYQTSNSTWICSVDQGTGGGEVNTASNVGSGIGVFDTKNVFDLEFNSLIAGDGIWITDTTQDLTIDVDGSVLRNTDVAEPKFAVLTAGGATLQASATAAKVQVNGANIDYWVLDFDTASDETVAWNWEVPDNFNATGDINVRVSFQVNTGTAGVCFKGSWLGRTGAETVDVAFGTVVGGCDSTTGANQIETASIIFTSAQHGLAAGDVAFFKLTRDTGHATDTNINDARLIDVRVEWNK